jgi:hypothetical protein
MDHYGSAVEKCDVTMHPPDGIWCWLVAHPTDCMKLHKGTAESGAGRYTFQRIRHGHIAMTPFSADCTNCQILRTVLSLLPMLLESVAAPPGVVHHCRNRATG